MGLFKFRHSSFLPYYAKVYRRMRAFERKVECATKAPTMAQRIKFAQDAVQWAVDHATGYCASPELEKIYLEMAATLPDVKCTPIKDTILHVMTRAYMSGGHTRVAQRWIDLSRSGEKHDVVVLEQGAEPFPSWLEEAAVKHRGQIIRFDEPDLIKRAEKLRTLAAKYERIILHIHMDDPTALIAFGVESFTTPIILFNHADHLFWLGVSIADMVAEYRHDHISQEHASLKRRDVKMSFVLGIPCAVNELHIDEDRRKIRKELGIAENEFVIVTTGIESKYRPLGGNCLCKQFVKIVKQHEHVTCYAIGPENKTEYWQWAIDESNGKIHPLGLIKDKSLYYKYLLAADLYIGSYPYGGGTAMLDAVQCGLPYIQLLVTRQQKRFNVLHPELDQTSCLCYTTKELIDKINKVIRDKNEYDALLETSKKWADDYSNLEEWKKRLYDMYEQCPKQHHIHSFEIRKGKQVIIDDETCLVGLMYEREKFDIKNPLIRRLANTWLRLKGL